MRAEAPPAGAATTRAREGPDRAAVIEELIATARALAGSGPFDEECIRELVARAVDRGTDFAARCWQPDGDRGNESKR